MKGRDTPSKAKRELGAKRIGWANKEGVFRASSFSSTYIDRATGEIFTSGSEYATFRFGNRYLTVTKRVGEFLVQGYEQRIKMAKTKKEVEEINKFYEQYLNEKPGQVGVLLENISKESGIGQVFQAKLTGKLSPEMSAKFDYLTELVSEINKNRAKAELFYVDTQKAFKQVANKYKDMQEQGGYLDEFQVQELEEALDNIIKMAEQYTGRAERHQMKLSIN